MEYKDFSKNNLELIVYDFTIEQLREERKFLNEVEYARVFDYEYNENLKEAKIIYQKKIMEQLRELSKKSTKMFSYNPSYFKVPEIKLDKDDITNMDEIWRVQQLNYLKEWNK